MSKRRPEADLDPVHARCRAWGHAWEPYDVKQAGTRYIERLKCLRCGTVKSNLLDRRGYLQRNGRYIYPEGYRILGRGLHTTEGRARVRLQVLYDLLQGQDSP